MVLLEAQSMDLTRRLIFKASNTQHCATASVHVASRGNISRNIEGQLITVTFPFNLPRNNVALQVKKRYCAYYQSCCRLWQRVAQN